MRVLAVIPARKGSNRVPGKNTNEVRVLGIPLWQRAVEVASQVGDPVRDWRVSTDDPEMLGDPDWSRIMVTRPHRLCGPTVPMVQVMRDVVSGLLARDAITHVLCLQPSCPMRDVSDVLRCIDVARATGVDSVVTVNAHGKGWRRNGSVYLQTREALFRNEYMWQDSCAVVETEHRIDVDTPQELEQVVKQAEERGW